MEKPDSFWCILGAFTLLILTGRSDWACPQAVYLSVPFLWTRSLRTFFSFDTNIHGTDQSLWVKAQVFWPCGVISQHLHVYSSSTGQRSVRPWNIFHWNHSAHSSSYYDVKSLSTWNSSRWPRFFCCMTTLLFMEKLLEVQQETTDSQEVPRSLWSS